MSRERCQFEYADGKQCRRRKTASDSVFIDNELYFGVGAVSVKSFLCEEHWRALNPFKKAMFEAGKKYGAGDE